MVLGGSLVHMGFGSSAALQSGAAGPAEPWLSNHSGWSRPLLPDLAALAASEEAQLEAVRARLGWTSISRVLSSNYDKRTHRRLSINIQQKQDEGPLALLSPRAATGGAKPPRPPSGRPTAAGLHLRPFQSPQRGLA